MIYFRHKETGFIASHKDLKEIYNEAKEKGIYNYIVTFIAPYKLLPYEEEMNAKDVTYIFPSESLGSFFSFNKNEMLRNQDIGYKDAYNKLLLYR